MLRTRYHFRTAKATAYCKTGLTNALKSMGSDALSTSVTMNREKKYLEIPRKATVHLENFIRKSPDVKVIRIEPLAFSFPREEAYIRDALESLGYDLKSQLVELDPEQAVHTNFYENGRGYIALVTPNHLGERHSRIGEDEVQEAIEVLLEYTEKEARGFHLTGRRPSCVSRTISSPLFSENIIGDDAEIKGILIAPLPEYAKRQRFQIPLSEENLALELPYREVNGILTRAFGEKAGKTLAHILI